MSTYAKFYWVTGCSIGAVIAVAAYMTGAGEGSNHWRLLYQIHGSLSLIILPLTVIWFYLWVFEKKRILLTHNIAKPILRFFRLSHFITIMSSIVLCLSAWFFHDAVSLQGFKFLNLISLPKITPHDASFARAMLGLHILMSWLIIVFGGIVIAICFYSHMKNKNSNVKSFSAGKKRKKPSNVHHLGGK